MTKNMDASTKILAKGIFDGKFSVDMLSQSFTVATAKAIALKGVSLALNAGLMFLVQAGFTILYKIIDNVIHRSEKLAEAFAQIKNEVADSENTIEEHARFIDGLGEKYYELSKNVDITTNTNLNLSDDDYKEFLNIQNQLAEIYPELVTGWDAEGNAIIRLGDSAEENDRKLKELLETEKSLLNYQKISNLPEVFDAVKDNTENNIKRELANAQRTQEGYEKFLNTFMSSRKNDTRYQFGTQGDSQVIKDWESILKDLKIEYKKSYSSGGEFTFFDIVGFTPEQIKSAEEKLIKQYQSSINNASAQVTASQSKLKKSLAEMIPYIQAYLTEDFNYNSLSQSGQDLVQKIIQGLDLTNYDNWNEMKADINELLLNLVTLSDEDERELETKLSELFALDPNSISIEDWKTKVDEIISWLAGILKMDAGKLRIVLGIDVDYDNTESLVKQLEDKGFKDAGKLTKPQLEFAYSLDNVGNMSLDEVINKYNEAQAKAAEDIRIKVSVEDAISDTQSLVDGLEMLKEVYEDVANGKDFDFSKLVSEDFKNTFGSYTQEYQNLINTIANSPTDLQACQGAFDNLVSAYLDGEIAANRLNEANKNVVIRMLEQTGVVNAATIVNNKFKESEIKAKLAAIDCSQSIEQITETLRAELSIYGLTESAIDGLVETYTEAQSIISSLVETGTLKRLGLMESEVKGIKTLAEAQALVAGINPSEGLSVAEADRRYATDYDFKQKQDDVAKIVEYGLLQERLSGIIADITNTDANFTPNIDTSSGDNGLSKLISDINSATDIIDAKISKLKEKLNFAELQGDTSAATELRIEISKLLGQKAESLTEANKEIAALKTKYSLEEDIQEIEKAILSNDTNYYSTLTEQKENDLAITEKFYEAENTALENGRKYNEYLRKKMSDTSLSLLELNTKDIASYDKQISNLQITLDTAYKIGLTDDSDAVQKIKDEIKTLEDEQYTLKLNNIKLEFDIVNQKIEEGETLKSQIQNAITLANLQSNTELSIDLQLKATDISFSELEMLDKTVIQLTEERRNLDMNSLTFEKDYQDYTARINEALEKRGNIVDDLINQFDELAKQEAELVVYGKQGKTAWEKENQAMIDSINEAITALENQKSGANKEDAIQKTIDEIDELEKKLNNLKNNKDIKVLTKDINGEWQWDYIADYEKIAETEEEIENKREELNDLYIDQQIESLQSEADALEEQKTLKEQQYEDEYTTRQKYYNQMIISANQHYVELNTLTNNGLNTVNTTIDTQFQTMYDTTNTWLGEIVDNWSGKLAEIRTEIQKTIDAANELSDIDGAISNDNSNNTNSKSIEGMAKGGEVYTTGFQLLHGTQYAPERVLSAEQTKAFNRLVENVNPFNNAIERVISNNIVNNTSNINNEDSGVYIDKVSISVKGDNPTQISNEIVKAITGLAQKSKIQKAK